MKAANSFKKILEFGKFKFSEGSIKVFLKGYIYIDREICIRNQSFVYQKDVRNFSLNPKMYGFRPMSLFVHLFNKMGNINSLLNSILNYKEFNSALNLVEFLTFHKKWEFVSFTI
jgi:hypothetical protein